MAPKRYIPLFGCLFHFGIAHSQVLNMDRVSAPGDSAKKWSASLQANTDYNSEKAIFDWDTQIDITRYIPGHHILVTKFSNTFTNTSGSNLQNAGYIHLRYRDNDTRRFSPEYFTQYQWDDLRGMKNRYLTGCNLRMKLKEGKQLDLYLGLGLMYEWEKWNFNGVAPDKLPLVHPDFIRTELLKINQYVKVSAKIFNTSEFTFTNFIQTRPDKYFKYPRVASFLQWNVSISKKVSVNLSFESIYDALPVVPIKNFYFNYKTGFTVTI